MTQGDVTNTFPPADTMPERRRKAFANTAEFGFGKTVCVDIFFTSQFIFPTQRIKCTRSFPQTVLPLQRRLTADRTTDTNRIFGEYKKKTG